MDEAEARAHKPALVYADDANGISHARNAIPAQAA